MRAIVDTNLYEVAFFPHSTQAKQKRIYKELHRRFTLFHNVIALVELVRHRALKNSVRSEIHRLLAAEEQIFCPDLKDWKLSAYIVGELRNQNQHMNKVALRKMQMDALIAALAIRHKLTLVSADSDFELIRRTRAGRILRIFQIAS